VEGREIAVGALVLDLLNHLHHQQVLGLWISISINCFNYWILCKLMLMVLLLRSSQLVQMQWLVMRLRLGKLVMIQERLDQVCRRNLFKQLSIL
jgi:hypothetical protein